MTLSKKDFVSIADYTREELEPVLREWDEREKSLTRRLERLERENAELRERLGEIDAANS